MRATLILLGMLLWLTAAAAWLAPRKRALLRKHHAHLRNADIIQLTRDDFDAWTLYRDTCILLGVGLVGGLAIVLTH
ncbi:hypothetical protein H8N03_14885 [Ramlibacter sp. USB13]|uniref:Uncharacterized protein n=1 Tax=Ramlibacter cellulosilyticus TaxID=2764187 RepID=A0A923MRN7_9BURK|nr:hypothetical protein [Ramlibacter cellulosilyticus]MBC5784235.1 hypothetical protein [Ramlibacter cellulosilyticus]